MAGRRNYGADSGVGGPNDGNAFLYGAQTGGNQMLIGAGAGSVPAVVGQIDQKLRFVFLIYHLGGKYYFVTNERAERGIVFQFECFVAFARFEVGDGVGNRTHPFRKITAERDVFAERHQVAFVIEIDDFALFVNDEH